MKPAKLNLALRPGATFPGLVLLALDPSGDPIDLAGYIPFATVRAHPAFDSPVLIDLSPGLVSPGTLTNPVTVDFSTNLLTSTAHGLIPGMTIQFLSDGVMPKPLDEDILYVVLYSGLTPDTFRVMTIDVAKTGLLTPVELLTTGTGTLTA